jgi:hypothetical protein
LHIVAAGTGSGLPCLLAWSRESQQVRSFAFGPKCGRDGYNIADCTLILDAAASLVDPLPSLKGIDYHGESLRGDFYGFAPVEQNGGLALWVGDVGGHPIESALLTSALQANVRRLTAEKGTNLPAILRELNEASCTISPEHSFATLFYAQFEPLTRELAYASAGYEPAILLRGDAELCESLEPTGTVLGMSSHSEFAIRTIRLFPGEVLIVHTGALSAASIRRIVRGNPEASASAIAWRVLQESASQSGDRSVVVLRCKSEPPVQHSESLAYAVA